MTEPVRYGRLETVILDHLGSRELAVIDGAVWPGVGDVIELANPTRDAVVTGVRLQLRQREDDDRATIVVLVNDGEPGDTIAREPAIEALLEPTDELLIEPAVVIPPPD